MRDNDSSIKGYVLIIVLFVLAATTTILVNFINTVYLYASTADNFMNSEKMSTLLKAAYRLSIERGKEFYSKSSYNSLKEIPFEDAVEDLKISVLAVDNNSKFNINSLVYSNGLVNQTAYEIFKRLLRELDINEDYADIVIDYIDKDKISRSATGEARAKDYYLFSLSELDYIFKKEDRDKILPYITFFGDGKLNINTIDYPLIKALHNNMTDALAKRIMDVRMEKPFENIAAITKIAGMETIGLEISNIISVKNNSFMLYLKAEKGDFSEAVEAGFELQNNIVITRYWKEL